MEECLYVELKLELMVAEAYGWGMQGSHLESWTPWRCMSCVESEWWGHLTWKVKNKDQTFILGRLGDKSVIGTNLAAIHSYD